MRRAAAATRFRHRAAGLAPVSIADNFNRADNYSTLGATSTGGITWLHDANHWDTVGNQAVANSSGGMFAFIDTGRSDGTVQVTLSTISTFGPQGPMARYQDASNCWYIRAKPGTNASDIIKRQGGTQFGMGVNWTAAQGDVYKIVMLGNSISFYQNSTLLLTDTSGFLASATKHGMLSQQSSGQTGGLDDWSFVYP